MMLQMMAKSRFTDLKLHMGCELLCAGEYIEDILYGLEIGVFLPLGDSKYVLTELYQDATPEEATKIVWALLSAGWKPILAHTERYPALFEKCRTCGYEWKSVVRARAKGSLCPVCADRTVLAGYNDLATTDPELLDEWDYEKNTGTLPTAVSRNSMKIVWWKCSSSHSWRAKITDRTIEQKGCYLCEREFQSAFPQLLIMLYAVRNGLKVTTNNDKLIGINLDTYIPELRLAIEAEATTITEQRSQMVKEHICECNGIRYVKLKHSNDLIKTAQSIKEAFRKCHTFFQTNDEEDIEILRTRFQNWRKQK